MTLYMCMYDNYRTSIVVILCMNYVCVFVCTVVIKCLSIPRCMTVFRVTLPGRSALRCGGWCWSRRRVPTAPSVAPTRGTASVHWSTTGRDVERWVCTYVHPTSSMMSLLWCNCDVMVLDYRHRRNWRYAVRSVIRHSSRRQGSATIRRVFTLNR